MVTPSGSETSFAYDLNVLPRDGGGLALTLDNFRDADRFSVRSHDPLMATAIAANHLRLEIGDDGTMLGTTALDEARAKLDRAPPGTEAVVAAARSILDDSVIEDAVAGHAADLWITWTWLWSAVGELPPPGDRRTAQVFGLIVTVRNLGAGADPGTVRLEARTERKAITVNDLYGGRAWFLPVGRRETYLVDDTSFQLVLTSEVELATLRPHHVALDIEERLMGRNGTPRRWRFEYDFSW